eukprot:m.302794 g.302794  ORF g.302794 m.302794 type:complete len:289 (+) comp20155_c0_seq3:377-1243(+)
MDEYDMQELYSWIDIIPLSRPKRNITRDFSDGVMVAEVVKHFAARLVDLHNYQPANSTKQKTENWKTLNNKVFKKLDFVVPPNVVQGVVGQKPGVIEVVLNNLRLKLQQYLAPPRVDTEITRLDRQNSVMDDYDRYDDRGSHGTSNHLPAINSKRRPAGGGSGPRTNKNIRVPPPRHLPAHRSAPVPPPGRSGRERGGGHAAYNGGFHGRNSAHPREFADHRQSSPPMGREIQNDDPYDVIEQQRAELVECHDMMEVMQVKIDKLTKLVQLKDKRIQDLSSSTRHGGR